MNNTDVKPKRPQPKHDRLVLSSDALNRINGWLDQLRDQLKGIKVRRRDLVEYAVLSQPEQLSSRQVEDFRIRYFDEIEFAAWAIRKLKEGRAAGQRISLAELIGAAIPKQTRTKLVNDGKTGTRPKTISIEKLPGGEDIVARQ
jgi:hypothetical protein